MSSLDNYDQYRKWLAKRGYIVLGQGLMAAVYTKPGSNRAIKVSRQIDQWPDYVLWATKNRYAGTFAPKVYSLKFHKDFYVATMEVLVCTIGELRDKSWRNEQLRNYDSMLNGLYGEKRPISALDKFCSKAKEAEFNHDLHDNNFMVRSDGSVVLIDPSSRRSEVTKYRLKNGYIVNH